MPDREISTAPVARRPGRAVLMAGGLIWLGLLTGCGLLADGENGDVSVATTNVTGETVPPTLPGPDAVASETLVSIGDAEPGEIVGLRTAGGSVIEWIDRVDGEIVSLDLDDPNLSPQVVAEVTVTTIGRGWGLLDTVVLQDGRRFASWTQPGSGDFDNGNLVVGEIVDGAAVRLIWNAGRIPSTGIGGTLDEFDGDVVVSLGENVGWADENRTRGALVALDPDGGPRQTPVTISDGYVEPRAFSALDDELWVWDRAGARAPEDRTLADVERVGRADLGDRSDLVRSDVEPRRFPTAMVELPDGSIGVCGDDGQLRSYPVTATDDGPRSGVGPSEAVMPCSTSVAVLADGAIVTVATVAGLETLQIRR